ncbi:MAG: hypothetical protein U5J96_10160 [Ignavibacteriaceae bacterium]|nr:hypothetical protein [Ignavibacteriaceae bacterium]
MNNDNDLNKNAEDSPPPILGSWNKIYGFVFFNLIVLILLFYLFTKAFE